MLGDDGYVQVRDVSVVNQRHNRECDSKGQILEIF